MKALLFAALALALAWVPAAGEELPAKIEADVVAYRTSNVNAKVVGNVSEVLVTEGQSVAKGDILARLDDAVALARTELARIRAEDDSYLKSAELQLAYYKNERDRLKNMSDAARSEMALDQAEQNVKVAEANVATRKAELDQLKAAADLQQESLNEYTVYAPFDGIVSRKTVEVGEATYPIDKELFEIIDISRVYVVFSLPPKFLSEVKVKSTVSVLSALYPEERFTGNVSFISPSIEGGYSRIKVLVENPEGLLRSGMEVMVTFMEDAPEETPGETP